MPRWDNQKSAELLRAILALRDLSEAKKFFRDLLTEAEILEFTKRWQAAQMLNQNISYQKIEKVTGLSSRTIARVAKWLKQGKGGYKLVISRLAHHHNSSSFGKGLS